MSHRPADNLHNLQSLWMPIQVSVTLRHPGTVTLKMMHRSKCHMCNASGAPFDIMRHESFDHGHYFPVGKLDDDDDMAAPPTGLTLFLLSSYHKKSISYFKELFLLSLRAKRKLLLKSHLARSCCLMLYPLLRNVASSILNFKTTAASVQLMYVTQNSNIVPTLRFHRICVYKVCWISASKRLPTLLPWISSPLEYCRARKKRVKPVLRRLQQCKWHWVFRTLVQHSFSLVALLSRAMPLDYFKTAVLGQTFAAPRILLLSPLCIRPIRFGWPQRT